MLLAAVIRCRYKQLIGEPNVLCHALNNAFLREILLDNASSVGVVLPLPVQGVNDPLAGFNRYFPYDLCRQEERRRSAVA